MIKKNIILSLAAVCWLSASADIKISCTENAAVEHLTISRVPLSELFEARTMSDLNSQTDVIAAVDGVFSFQSPATVAEQYSISLLGSEEPIIRFFANPSDNVSVVVSKDDNGNLSASASGTELIDGIAQIEKDTKELEMRLIAIRQGTNTADDWDSLYAEYRQVFVDFVKSNPNHQAAAFAILYTPEEDFLQLFETLGENAKSSLYYPIVEKQQPRVAEQLRKIRLQKELESGVAPAPDFTLPGLDGKQISLSDFKGKWVVLDFWGSWCGWCIKGFPKMKEAYQKYAEKVEFIGIDCGDTLDKWKAAVEKYEIPWVNVYNDTEIESDNRVDIVYGIQGYPTKIIISPDAKIKKIVTGEDPQFYIDLDNFLK